ncbi:hypothetical protein BsWGS_16465 [Bradybaena similaris]
MRTMTRLYIVLLLGFTCVVQTTALVCPYSVRAGCECTASAVTCRNLQEFPPLFPGASMNGIPVLSFENGNITTISSGSLPAGLTELWLIGHPLTNISDDAFDASRATLRHVMIKNAEFQALPRALLKLTGLIDLEIRHTDIEYWDTAILKHLTPRLEKLELQNVSLSAWPTWISDFHSLSSLDLSFNSLKSIPDDAFSSITDSLTELRLSQTDLTQLPQALSTLSSLTYLNLNYNTLTDASEVERIAGFPFAQKLSALYLDDVGLNRTPNFSNLTSLTQLDIDFNKLSDIPNGSLPASLTTFSASYNDLSEIPADISSLPRLEYLSLSANRISEIKSNTLSSRLIELNIYNNNITIITNTTLRNLRRLTYLYLDSNPISTISRSAFADLVSLRYVYFEDSHLTEFPVAFAQLGRVADISFTTTQPLSCPCPAAQELVQWFTSLTDTTSIQGSCSNGQPIDSYLSGQCGQATATY